MLKFSFQELRKAPNKKIQSLTAFAGTQTRGLLRILAHAPAPLI